MFLTTNMAAMTSRAIKQYELYQGKQPVYHEAQGGKQNFPPPTKHTTTTVFMDSLIYISLVEMRSQIVSFDYLTLFFLL